MDGCLSMELAELTSWFYSTEQNFDFRQSSRDNVSPSSSIFSLVSKSRAVLSPFVINISM